MMKKVGLRIDVDTLRGTRLGVPSLCEVLRRHKIKGTFYFSVGPDNMGRNLWRLLKPTFLKKMLRSDAASLYGWDIVLMGTAWPGPRIGKRSEEAIRGAAADGHEMGFHAWDHQKWQSQTERLSRAEIGQHLVQGVTELERILGASPTASAVPGWRCNDTTLLAKEAFQFMHNSDCRGKSTFYPIVSGQQLTTPQIPVTLPTYDEIIGRNGVTNENYNEHVLSQIGEDQLNVLTIHTEVEGLVCKDLFDDFLTAAHAQGIECVPMRELLMDFPPNHGEQILPREFAGREGWLACQESYTPDSHTLSPQQQ